MAFQYPRFGGPESVLHVHTWITVLCFNHLFLQYRRVVCGLYRRFNCGIEFRCLEWSLYGRRPLAETTGITPVRISCHDSPYDCLGVIHQGLNRPIKMFESVYTAPLLFFIGETVHNPLIRLLPNSPITTWGAMIHRRIPSHQESESCGRRSS